MELPRSTRRSTVVGNYILGDEIGKGAHGQVYRAIDKRDGRVVAVKEIPLRATSAYDVDAIESECALLRSLSHRNVTRFLGTVRAPEHLYILLELAENGSLAGVIKPSRFGPTPGAARRVLRRAAARRADIPPRERRHAQRHQGRQRPRDQRRSREDRGLRRRRARARRSREPGGFGFGRGFENRGARNRPIAR